LSFAAQSFLHLLDLVLMYACSSFFVGVGSCCALPEALCQHLGREKCEDHSSPCGLAREKHDFSLAGPDDVPFIRAQPLGLIWQASAVSQTKALGISWKKKGHPLKTQDAQSIKPQSETLPLLRRLLILLRLFFPRLLLFRRLRCGLRALWFLRRRPHFRRRRSALGLRTLDWRRSL
jgi:hypothetical protein